MKLEDFIKAAIKFYEFSAAKKATYVYDPSRGNKNTFNVTANKKSYQVYTNQRKVYVNYCITLPTGGEIFLQYYCETPKNLASAMIRFPLIENEIREKEKLVVSKGRTFFNSLPNNIRQNICFEKITGGFSFDKLTQRNGRRDPNGEYLANFYLDQDNDFYSLKSKLIYIWEVVPENDDQYDHNDHEGTDLDQAFDNFVAEFTRLYLPVENQPVPVQEAKIKDQIIWHGTSTKFNTFQPKTAWFHLTRNEGIGAALVNNDQRCYLLKCKLNKNVVIATEKQAQKVLNTISKKFGIEDEFMYSMLDPSVGEFDTRFISAFKEALIKAGYGATYMEDESQLDPGGPTFVRSIAVFSPDKDVKILETINGEKLRAEHDRLLDLPNFL
jgi:hypothetical protein